MQSLQKFLQCQRSAILLSYTPVHLPYLAFYHVLFCTLSLCLLTSCYELDIGRPRGSTCNMQQQLKQSLSPARWACTQQQKKHQQLQLNLTEQWTNPQLHTYKLLYSCIAIEQQYVTANPKKVNKLYLSVKQESCCLYRAYMWFII